MAIDAKVRKIGDPIPDKIDSSGKKSKISTHWWLELEGKAHAPLMALVKNLEEEQEPRWQLWQRYLRMYGGPAMLQYDFRNKESATPLQSADRINLNVIQSVVDAATNKIAKNRPLPMFLTEGGSFEEKLRGKNLGKYIAGVFHAEKVHEKGQQAFRFGGILGKGFAKVFRQGDSPKVEWVFPGEILVDEVEALYGMPRNLHQIKFISREVLKGTYAEKHKEAIEKASTEEGNTASTTQLEHIRVVESWHLPSALGADDGRHVIAITGADLLNEPWRKDYFPFPEICWSPPVLGFWGRGLAEELYGLQIEINKLLMKIQKAYQLVGQPWVFTKQGNLVPPAKLRNEIAAVFKYKGEKPDVKVFQAMHQEVYSHLDRLYNRAFEQSGISQLTAQSKKPAGIEAAVALRELNDIETERFVLIGQGYENFYMEIARQIIDVARDIHDNPQEKAKEEADGKRLSVRVPGKRFVETITWENVDLKDDQFVMKVFPVSSLPSTPSAKFQAVTERIEAGMLSKEQAMQLLDFPDLSAENDLGLAALENIDWTINEILEKGKLHFPDPFQNLQLGIERMHAALLMATTDGAPDEKLEMMREWIVTAEGLLSPPAPPEANTMEPQGQELATQAQIPMPPDQGLPATEPPPVLS